MSDDFIFGGQLFKSRIPKPCPICGSLPNIVEVQTCKGFEVRHCGIDTDPRSQEETAIEAWDKLVDMFIGFRDNLVKIVREELIQELTPHVGSYMFPAIRSEAFHKAFKKVPARVALIDLPMPDYRHLDHPPMPNIPMPHICEPWLYPEVKKYIMQDFPCLDLMMIIEASRVEQMPETLIDESKKGRSLFFDNLFKKRKPR